MPVATVEFVTEIPHDTTYLQRFHLDTPRRGEAREGFVVRFGGWAIGTGKSRLESSHVRALAEFSCRSIDDFYRQQAQAQGKSDPRVFAEKTVGENIAARTLRDLLPQTRRLHRSLAPRPETGCGRQMPRSLRRGPGRT